MCSRQCQGVSTWNEIRPPPGYRIENVITAWQQARRANCFIDDPSLEGDEAALSGVKLGTFEQGGCRGHPGADITRESSCGEQGGGARRAGQTHCRAQAPLSVGARTILKPLAVTIMRVMQRKEIRTSRPDRFRHRGPRGRRYHQPGADPGHICRGRDGTETRQGNHQIRHRGRSRRARRGTEKRR